MDPDDSSTPVEHESTQESAALLNKDMDDLDIQNEMDCINFCFKMIGLQECT